MTALRTTFDKLRALPKGRLRGPSVSITMIKNEQDIVEPFIRHNRRFFDEMVLLNHLSDDRTREIIQACATELGGIHLVDLTDPAQNQGHFVSAAVADAQERLGADIIGLLDADEFLACNDRAHFEAMMRRVPIGHSVKLKWRTYLPDPERQGAQCPVARMGYRRVKELPQHNKAFLRVGGNRSSRFVVSQGSHVVYHANGKKTDRSVIKGFILQHLPVRSREQILTKCAIGWSSDSRRPDAHPDDSSQWAEIGRRIIQDGANLDEIKFDLAQHALGYTQDDPVPIWPDNVIKEKPMISFTRRYSDGSYGDPHMLIAAARKRLGY